MDLVSYFLSLLLAAYTVLVEPFARTSFYRSLKKQLAINPAARLQFYRRQILLEWGWVVVIALIFVPKTDQLSLTGIALPDKTGWIITAILLVGAALFIFLARRNPNTLANIRKNLVSSPILLPTTAVERSWYVAAAFTAGICEELLYRGFFIYFLRTNLPMLNTVILLSLVSGIVYGLSRAYQGSRGILQTGITGFLFAIVLFLSSSLVPAMVFHTLVDITSLLTRVPEVGKKDLP
jgi:membrane protease YdiL (CAAX protease family)